MAIQIGNSGTEGVGEGDIAGDCVGCDVGLGVGAGVGVGVVIVTCIGVVCILYVGPVSPSILYVPGETGSPSTCSLKLHVCCQVKLAEVLSPADNGIIAIN